MEALSFSLRLDMQWEGFRKLKLQNKDKLYRGLYRISSYFLVVRDSYLFLEFRRKGEVSHPFQVYPLSGGGDRRTRTESLSDTADLNRRTSLKDPSFFESRPYSPGDDPRRINWNLLARYGDFFIKEGFRMAPDQQSLLLVINGMGEWDAVDELMRECCLWMVSLLKNGTGLTVFSSGPGSPKVFRPGVEAAVIEDFLSMIPPLDLSEIEMQLPFQFGKLLFFSSLSGLPDLRVFKNITSITDPPVLITTDSEESRKSTEMLEQYRKGGWHVYRHN